jgi:hypothetical protein
MSTDSRLQVLELPEYALPTLLRIHEDIEVIWAMLGNPGREGYDISALEIMMSAMHEELSQYIAICEADAATIN